MEIMLKNVRPSYPHLFEKDRYEKYSCTLVCEGENKKKVEKSILKLIEENGVNKEKLKNVPFKPSNEVDGAGDLRTGDRKTRPFVLDSKKDLITDEEDSKIYPGCLVNAKVQLYYTNGQYGQFIGAKLIAIQYAGDAEPFGGSTVTPSKALEGFDEIEEEEMDFLT